MQMKTRQHAHELVVQAKIGTCSNEATEEFMLALRSKLLGWVDRIDETLAKRRDIDAVDDDD